MFVDIRDQLAKIAGVPVISSFLPVLLLLALSFGHQSLKRIQSLESIYYRTGRQLMSIVLVLQRLNASHSLIYAHLVLVPGIEYQLPEKGLRIWVRESRYLVMSIPLQQNMIYFLGHHSVGKDLADHSRDENELVDVQLLVAAFDNFNNYNDCFFELTRCIRIDR